MSGDEGSGLHTGLSGGGKTTPHKQCTARLVNQRMCSCILFGDMQFIIIIIHETCM